MSRLADIRSQLSRQGKSVVSYGADLVEWSAEKNLAVAGDIASFAVAQMRLTAEAEDFSEYRAEFQQSFAGFGEVMREHGQDYVAKLRDLPEEFREVVSPAPRKSTRKTATRKKAAAKKAVPKKATPRKATPKKAAPKQAA